MIEVEVKFLVSGNQEKFIVMGSENLGTQKFRDTYYDYLDFRLTLADWWLRLRNIQFELKKSPGPVGYNQNQNSQRYVELTREKDIMQVLNITGQNLASALEKNHIIPFAAFNTERRSFKQGQFRIDLDRTDSGFQLGEIELLVNSESEIEAAEKSILQFLAARNIPPAPSQKGKLENYLEQNSPAHFTQLVKAGVIDP